MREKISKIKSMRVVNEGVDVGKSFGSRQIATYASSIAFFFFLSAIPLIITFACLVPFTSISVSEIMTVIMQVAPSAAEPLINTIISEAYSRSADVLPFSFVVLLFSASQGMNAIRSGLNRVYEQRESRFFLIIWLRSFVYTLLIMILLSGALVFVFGNAVIKGLQSYFPELDGIGIPENVIYKILFWTVGMLLFAAFYTFIPAGRRKFKWQIPGALFSAAVWYGFSIIFTIYVNGINKYTSFYGSVGTIAILLFWLYCCFYILLIGGFINCQIFKRFLKPREERKALELEEQNKTEEEITEA